VCLSSRKADRPERSAPLLFLRPQAEQRFSGPAVILWVTVQEVDRYLFLLLKGSSLTRFAGSGWKSSVQESLMIKRDCMVVLLVVLFSSSLLFSKDKRFPADIVSAKSVAVIGRVGAGSADLRSQRGAELKAEAEARLKAWGRYQIVDDPARADLVIVLLERFPVADTLPLWHSNLDPAAMFVFKGGTHAQWDGAPLWITEEKSNLLHTHAVTVAINNFEKAVKKADKKAKP
jgi:hypothetical protein